MVLACSARHRRTPGAVAAVLVVLVFDVVVAVHAGRALPADFSVYRMDGAALGQGRPLYSQHDQASGLGFTYPVFAALAFVPLAMVPGAVAFVAVLLVNTALLGGLCVLLVRHVGLPTRALPGLVSLGLLCEPVTETFALGQVNLLLVALVLADLLVLPGRRPAGIGIGLAAGLKVTPALFIVYCLLTRRWRAFWTSLTTFLATVALGFVVRPADSWHYWTSGLFDTARVGSQTDEGNAGVTAMLAPLFGRDLPILLALLIGVAILAWVLPIAARLDRGGEVLAGAAVCGLGGLLVCPVSWSHHWIWLPVAALALCRPPGTGRLLAGAAAFVMLVDLRWVLVQAEHHGATDLRAASAALFAVLATVLMTALTVVRAPWCTRGRTPWSTRGAAASPQLSRRRRRWVGADGLRKLPAPPDPLALGGEGGADEVRQ